MKLITWKSYGIETGMPFADISELKLERDGFQSLGEIHKSADANKTVKEMVKEYVGEKGFSVAVYQAKTRKRGEYEIAIFAK